jgi:prepilin signal peptidase PulO-like enzyme (type II secretory pathway)
MILAIFFILGLAVGSFLNVVVYRLRMAETLVMDRSHCPHCKETIVWYDNIPVISFILLKFRCRNCHEKISWQYPLVEILAGILFVLVGYYFFQIDQTFSWIASAYYLAIISFLLVILVYDFLYMEIPSIVLALGIFLAIVFNLFADGSKEIFLGMQALDFSTYSGVLAAIVSFSFFFLMVAVSKEKWMGMGDAYLVIFLGLIVGWPNILLALLLSFSFGALAGIGLILGKKKKMGSQLPFAPFLVLGTIVTIFWHEPVIRWYLNLFIF